MSRDRPEAHEANEETTMCRAVTCRTCGKTGWAGCGQHVDQVLRGVPKAQRCSCPPREKKGFLASLFGR